MATRPPRSGSGSSPGGRRSPKRIETAGPPQQFEDVAARAARLGITVDRVLIEYARIAFADLRHIVEDTPEGITAKPPDQWTDADAAAVSEIVPASGSARSRVKLYDKKAALDAIARHLGMFPPPRRREDAAAQDEEEDPREFLARELARLAARAGQE